MIPRWLRRLDLLENKLKLAAILVLVAGLGCSLWVWKVQDRLERESAAQQAGDTYVINSPLDDRKQLRELELYGGKPAVLLEEAKGLFRGKTLAKTIAAASIALAAGLYLVTVRSPD